MLWVEWAAQHKAGAEAAITPAAPGSTEPATSTGFSSGLYSGPSKAKASTATATTAAPVAATAPVAPTGKEEVDAYIAKVKAGVNAVAKTRAEKKNAKTPEATATATAKVEVEVEVKRSGRSSYGDGKDKLRDALLSSTYTPRS